MVPSSIHEFRPEKIQDNYYTNIIYLHIYRLTIDPHNKQLPVDLLAQLIEHCTSIAEIFRLLLK